MISLYLNSLYNLLYRDNPFVLLYRYVLETARTLSHVPQNRKRVDARIARLEARVHSVEGYIISGQRTATRLNKYR